MAVFFWVCPLGGGAGPGPLVGRAVSWGVSRGGCGLRKSSDSLSAGGWGCIPVRLVVWPEASSTGACRLLGEAKSWCQNGHLQESSSWYL